MSREEHDPGVFQTLQCGDSDQADSDERVEKTGVFGTDPRKLDRREAISEIELLAVDSYPKLLINTVAIEEVTEDTVTISGIKNPIYHDE